MERFEDLDRRELKMSNLKMILLDRSFEKYCLILANRTQREAGRVVDLCVEREGVGSEIRGFWYRSRGKRVEARKERGEREMREIGSEISRGSKLIVG
jgi:hypothetical protein